MLVIWQGRHRRSLPCSRSCNQLGAACGVRDQSLALSCRITGGRLSVVWGTSGWEQWGKRCAKGAGDHPRNSWGCRAVSVRGIPCSQPHLGSNLSSSLSASLPHLVLLMSMTRRPGQEAEHPENSPCRPSLAQLAAVRRRQHVIISRGRVSNHCTFI